jgi:hypothetical protein
MAEAIIPDVDGGEAAEGTAAHEVGQNIILHNLDWLSVNQDEGAMRVGDITTRGVVVTSEIQECAELYANYCTSLVTTETQMWWVEDSVTMQAIHPLMHGTPDFDTLDLTNGILHVNDYKHGHGQVDAYQNTQLTLYAFGRLMRLEPEHLALIHTVRLAIIQPRCYHKEGGVVDTWDVSPAYIMTTFAARARKKAEQALGGSPLCRSGSWCKNCKALNRCEAVRKAATNAIDVIENLNHDNVPNEHVATEYAILLRAFETIEMRKDALEADVTERMKRGPVPGLRVKTSAGRKKWSKSNDEVFVLGDLYGVDLRKPQEPITVTQAIKKGIDEVVNSSYITRSTGSAKVVLDDGSYARRIFNNPTGRTLK